MSSTEITSYAARLDDLRVVTLTDGEVWSARDLMELAGYTDWRNWSKAIDRSIASVNASGLNGADHFVGSNKMVDLGSGGRRQVEDVEITRYGAYILFQNADASKPEIAAAQQYFAVKTRQQELAGPELPGDYLSALKALVAREEANQALTAKVEADAPKVEYVDSFVDRDDAVTFRVAASEIGMREGELRERLIAAGWVYSTRIGRRWSESRAEYVDEIEYRASSAHGDKFALRPQHKAPRHHNGQVRQTLYIRSDAMTAIKRRVLSQLKAVGA